MHCLINKSDFSSCVAMQSTGRETRRSSKRPRRISHFSELVCSFFAKLTWIYAIVQLERDEEGFCTHFNACRFDLRCARSAQFVSTDLCWTNLKFTVYPRGRRKHLAVVMAAGSRKVFSRLKSILWRDNSINEFLTSSNPHFVPINHSSRLSIYTLALRVYLPQAHLMPRSR